jgi:hypothetical protein
MKKLPIEVAVNKIGAQSSDDVDPLCMLDPWCVTSNVQNTPYSATVGSDAWAHWKPQRVQFENFNSTRTPSWELVRSHACNGTDKASINMKSQRQAGSSLKLERMAPRKGACSDALDEGDGD